MNALFEHLHDHAQRYPQAVAIRAEDQQLTFPQLLRQVERQAEALAQQPQQQFLLNVEDPVAWVIRDLALMRANKVCIPLPPFFSQQQQAYLKAKVDAGQMLPDGTQKVTFTSGSTGEPKGVCLSVANQLNTVAALATRVASVQVRRHLVVMPLAVLLENVAGVYLALWLGAEVVLLRSETLGLQGSSGLHAATFFKALRHYKPDSLILTPGLLRVLISGAECGVVKADSFKLLAVGGARLSPTLEHQALSLNLPVVQGYGLSEFGSVVAFNDPSLAVAGTVGKPLAHARVALIDGEIRVSGNAMLGYWDEPGSWYPDSIDTGDLGAIDEHGRLRILGRRKHIIVTDFGRNVDPEWVEAEFCSHPAIYQAAVMGDEQMPLTALLVLMPEITADQARDAVRHINTHLPDYARIRRYVQRNEPFSVDNNLLTGTGRLRRGQVQRLAQQLFNTADNPSTNEVTDGIF